MYRRTENNYVGRRSDFVKISANKDQNDWIHFCLPSLWTLKIKWKLPHVNQGH